jgi:BatD DUF11 like domain
MNILDLPSSGRPPLFSGGVGQFDFTVTAAPTEIRAGDPVTLKMTLQGNGNLSAVQFPALPAMNNVKTYDPIIKETSGSKTLEQILIPQSGTELTIPEIHFHYFDPDLKQYQRITRGPWKIKLNPGPEGYVAPAVSAISQSTSAQVPEALQETVGEDFVYIKSDPGRLTRQGQYFYTQAWFYGVGIIVSIGYGLWVGWLRHRRRLNADPQFARRVLAGQTARQSFRQARHLLAQGQTDAAYGVLHQAFNQYISQKCSIPIGRVSGDTLKQVLHQRALQTELSDGLKLWNEFEHHRYAPGPLTPFHVEQTLAEVKNFIDRLEKKL